MNSFTITGRLIERPVCKQTPTQYRSAVLKIQPTEEDDYVNVYIYGISAEEIERDYHAGLYVKTSGICIRRGNTTYLIAKSFDYERRNNGKTHN